MTVEYLHSKETDSDSGLQCVCVQQVKWLVTVVFVVCLCSGVYDP